MHQLAEAKQERMGESERMGMGATSGLTTRDAPPEPQIIYPMTYTPSEPPPTQQQPIPITTNNPLNIIPQNRMSTSWKANPFSLHGDPTRANMNDLLRSNILLSQYYRDLQLLHSVEEIIDQIQYHCHNAEPFTLGTNNIASTLFCCLYKLVTMRPSEGQIWDLMKDENPYVRCAGALFVRYMSKPDQLLTRLHTYLLDDMGTLYIYIYICRICT